MPQDKILLFGGAESLRDKSDYEAVYVGDSHLKSEENCRAMIPVFGKLPSLRQAGFAGTGITSDGIKIIAEGLPEQFPIEGAFFQNNPDLLSKEDLAAVAVVIVAVAG